MSKATKTAAIERVAQNASQNSILKSIQKRFERNRLGELLVQKGKITPQILKEALAEQRLQHRALGEILIERGHISATELRFSLWQQFAYRGMASAFAFFIGVAGLMGHVSPAHATSSLLRADPGMSRSYPEGAQPTARFIPASIHPEEAVRTAPQAPVESYPLLFGSREIRSRDISDFNKFTEVAARLQSSMTKDTPAVHAWQQQISGLRGLPLEEMADRVNQIANAMPYIEDKANYGKSDYWATPDQFFAKGGDCEDFAIAKYASLKALGVSEDHMRIAVVEDTWKSIPHAVLIVYTDNGPMILDNQNKDMRSAAAPGRYAPIYSINQEGWWRHVS